MGTIYKCDSSSIKGFPLTISGSRPTASSYTTNVETVEGLIDFQWATYASGLTPTRSSTGSIILQGTDSTNTVMYNTLKYTLVNVQITTAQHSSWLVEVPTSCTEELVILLQATKPTSESVYMIFVLPILTGGAQAPDYLKNIGAPAGTIASPTGIGSCFSAIPGAVFATYVTCFDGYTAHARTQNIKVFVSTVGMNVSTATMDQIKKDMVSIGRMELPSILAPSAGGGRGTGAGGSQEIIPQGGSSIAVTDFPSKITTTTFLTNLSNSSTAQNIRRDPHTAYKCVELNPDSLDTNGNLQVDLLSGELNSSTLQDILLEREVLKELAAPGQATPGTTYNNTAREVAAFLLAVIIAAIIFISVYSVISADRGTGTTAFGSWRFSLELGLSISIVILFIVGTGIGLFSKDSALKTQGGYVVAGAAGAAFLFYLIFMVWIPPVEATSLAVAAVGTGLSPAATAAPSTAPTKEATWSSWYRETRASINVGKWSTISVVIFATVLSFIGFLGGMLIQ